MERLFKCCGSVLSWKRSTDASGELKAFGFVEFESVEAVFACLKILNNMNLFDSKLIVKANEKTVSFLNDWKDLKKMEWLSSQEKAGEYVDLEDLEVKEKMGELMPYEKELIPDYDRIMSDIERTIDNKDIIE